MGVRNCAETFNGSPSLADRAFCLSCRRPARIPRFSLSRSLPRPSQPAPAGFEPGGLATVERFAFSYATPNATLTEVRLASKINGGTLLFIGTNHITPPVPELFAHLEELFTRERPTEAYIEVADTSYLQALPTDKAEVISTRGEPSYLGFIARQRGVAVLPLEPQPRVLFARLKQKYSGEQIALANILRDVQIARDRRRISGEALENVATQAINEQRQLVGESKKLSLKNVLTLTRAVNRLWPGLDWRQVPAEWFNPLLQPADTGSIFINALFAEEMAVRDEHALNLLLSRVAAGKQVIALAGRTHAENQLKALACLMSQR